jgi:hypothetical protein
MGSGRRRTHLFMSRAGPEIYVNGDLCDKVDRLEKPLHSLSLQKDGTLSGLLVCWLGLRLLCLKRLIYLYFMLQVHED